MWKDANKDAVRELVYQQMTHPIRNGIILPGVDCLEIFLALRLELIDYLTHFICFEKDRSVAEKIEMILDGLGISYEMHTRSGGLQELSLADVMGTRVSNFAYFDTCNAFTQPMYDFYKLYVAHYGSTIFSEDAVIAFNHCLGGRSSQKQVMRDIPFRNTANLMPPNASVNMKRAPYIMSALAEILPHQIHTSIMVPYKQEGKRTTMLNSIFKLEAID